jgi:altronate dehydratase
MTVSITWADDQKQILVATYAGHWTWDDHYRTIDEIATLLNRAEQRVDVVIDIHQSAGLPAGSMIPHVKYTINKMRAIPNCGATILIGASAFVHTMAEVLRKLRGEKTRMLVARDLEEARSLLARQPA